MTTYGRFFPACFFFSSIISVLFVFFFGKQENTGPSLISTDVPPSRLVVRRAGDLLFLPPFCTPQPCLHKTNCAFPGRPRNFTVDMPTLVSTSRRVFTRIFLLRLSEGSSADENA